MIMTCLNCARQHDYPSGWPARAALACWDCGTLHLADKPDQVRTATPIELQGLEQVHAFKDQKAVTQLVGEHFRGRAGMIPAQEYYDVASRAAKELGLDTTRHGGMIGSVGIAAINPTTGEGLDVTEDMILELIDSSGPTLELGGCFHCAIIDLFSMRGKRLKQHDAAQDTLDAIKAAACIVAAQRHADVPDDELIGRAMVSFRNHLHKAINRAKSVPDVAAEPPTSTSRH